MQRGDYAAAEERFYKLISLAPNNPIPLECLVIYGQGRAALMKL